MSQNTSKSLRTVLTMSIMVVVAGTVAAQSLPNGLVVRIHDTEELTLRLSETATTRILGLPDGTDLELLVGVDDPRLPRRDVTAFTALDQAMVLEALTAVELTDLQVTVDVYLLPAPPVETLGSFARRNAIYLSPGLGAVDPTTLHALVVHELGHVLTWAYFDRSADAWERYAETRGLELADHGAGVAHAERAREILAEDIRFLFGGDQASETPIENQSLCAPSEVFGLRGMLAESLRGAAVTGRDVVATAWPNPCRPSATVELPCVDFDKSASTDEARLQVMDVRGRVIRTIRGGRLENGRLAIAWNGQDDGGRRVAAGLYYYRISWDGVRGRGALTVLH